MNKNNMVGMILAGGRGTRLHELTEKVAKPAVYYGGKYRIIDFPLSNCANSGVDLVGVLTQYESVLLNYYVGQDSRWGLDAKDSGIFVLPPREKTDGFGLYRGTADAITQNIDFIDQVGAEYVLILSGDHIYKMDYAAMLQYHKEKNADVTIAVLEVTTREAKRFGIMETDQDSRIIDFEEKPVKPKSNLASMGIYIFDWKLLRKALIADMKDSKSTHDFGNDIIPNFLKANKRLFAYRFKGYWKDVGTIDSLWEANMDILKVNNKLDLLDPDWKIYTEDNSATPHFIGVNGSVKNSCVNQGSIIDGTVQNSVLFTEVKVEDGAKVNDTVIMPNVIVGKNAVIHRALIAENIKIGEGAIVGSKDSESILLVARNIKEGEKYE